MGRVKLLEAKDEEEREGACSWELGAAGSRGQRSASTRTGKLWGLLFNRVTVARDNVHFTITRSRAGEMLGG